MKNKIVFIYYKIEFNQLKFTSKFINFKMQIKTFYFTIKLI